MSTSSFCCKVTALGRNASKAAARLPYFDSPFFSFREVNISEDRADLKTEADIIFHLASTTHPVAYATEPISTISSNITGLKNLLEQSRRTEGSRFLFASSVEIYGENRGDVESFSEDYLDALNDQDELWGIETEKSLAAKYGSERSDYAE